LGPKRKTSPQEWAEELERHLLGTEGLYDRDDTTSMTLADPRLERLRSTLIPDFDLLDTPKRPKSFVGSSMLCAGAIFRYAVEEGAPL
jgi:hypothetical protein